MSSRTTEDRLIRRCVEASAARYLPQTEDEADIFRLAAQLVQTRFPAAAAGLARASADYFATRSMVSRRKFPELVKLGLVTDVPRLRNLLERQLEGGATW